MKKIKLITSLTVLATLGTSIGVLAGCSCNKGETTQITVTGCDYDKSKTKVELNKNSVIYLVPTSKTKITGLKSVKVGGTTLTSKQYKFEQINASATHKLTIYAAAMTSTKIEVEVTYEEEPTTQLQIVASSTSIKTRGTGNTCTLKATLSTKKNDDKVTWSVTSGEDYVVLSETESELGTEITVTGASEGTATIKATYQTYSATCNITVTEPATGESKITIEQKKYVSDDISIANLPTTIESTDPGASSEITFQAKSTNPTGSKGKFKFTFTYEGYVVYEIDSDEVTLTTALQDVKVDLSSFFIGAEGENLDISVTFVEETDLLEVIPYETEELKNETSLCFVKATATGLETTNEITIPETMLGGKVTVIGIADAAFCKQDEESGEPIGAKTSSIKFAKKENIEYIGGGAFALCENLTTIEIPENVSIEEIPVACFWKSGITSITIPANILSIDEEAFKDCSKLATITIAEPTTVQKEAGLGLAAIYNKAFMSDITLSNITLPSTCANIGSQAFDMSEAEDTSALTKVVLTNPESVTWIGGAAFKNCSKLSSINITKDTPLGGEETGSLYGSTFECCTALTEFTVPNSVAKIEGSVFKDSGVTKVTINTSTDYEWYQSNQGYNTTLDITNTSTNATNLKECDPTAQDNWGYDGIERKDARFTIDSNGYITGVTEKGSTASGDVIIPKQIGGVQIKGIKEGGCSGLAWADTVKFEDASSIDLIEEGAFAGSNIATFEWPENANLTEIKESTFEGCSRLHTITIPATVTKIGKKAFKDTHLTSATIANTGNWIQTNGIEFLNEKIIDPVWAGYYLTVCEGSETPTGENWGDTGIEVTTQQFLSKIELSGTYKTAYLVGDTFSVDGLKVTATWTDGTTQDVTDKVTFSKEKGSAIVATDKEVEVSYTDDTSTPSVTKKVTYALDVQDAQNNFTIDSNGYITLTEQGKAVEGTIIVPEKIGEVTVTGIADNGFQAGAYSSVEFKASDNITYIGSKSFYVGGWYGSLAKFVIPKNVTTIGDEAFYGCVNLTDISFEAGSQLTELSENVFSYCQMQSITLPASLATIKSYAFQYCAALKSITIPANVTQIEAKAFQDCSQLETDGTVTFESTDKWIQKDGTKYIDVTTPRTNAINLVNTGTGTTAWGGTGILTQAHQKIIGCDTQALFNQNISFEMDSYEFSSQSPIRTIKTEMNVLATSSLTGQFKFTYSDSETEVYVLSDTYTLPLLTELQPITFNFNFTELFNKLLEKSVVNAKIVVTFVTA